jgi:2-polyprenyl-6-methoxyphenol hydroxylase-like FAD-dependent oxidoreductase
MAKIQKDVCIAGAGPAGMILGLLLAKQGLNVLVLEHHKDFSREYRGEVLMPRFTQMMRQIGLFDYLEKFPNLKLTDLEGFNNGRSFFKIGFGQIAPEAPFALWMPQTVLLEALHEKAKLFPNFELWFDARAEDTIEENGKCTGVAVTHGGEKTEVRAKITAGADGRFSVIRKRGGFELLDEDHKFDLIWFTLEKPANYNDKVQFHLSGGCSHLILPKYPRHIQCGLVVEKGGYAKYAKQGIDSLRQVLLKSNSIFHDFAKNLKDFSSFNVLQAKIEYVKEWAKDGVVLVGDSAHTCSPAGAVGVSVATATAIVAAEVIGNCFKKNNFSKEALGEIQKLREKEVLNIQSRQKAFSGLLFTQASGKRREFFLFAAAFFAKAGLLKGVQRDLLVMKKPLPVSPEIGF